MVRFLMIALTGLLFGLLVFVSLVSRSIETDLMLVALVAAPGLSWFFPGLWDIDKAVPFWVVYIPVYLLSSSLGASSFLGKGAVGSFVAVVLGGLVCAVILASTMERSARNRVFLVGGMVGVGLLTAFFSGPAGGAGKFVEFLEHVLHLSPDAAAVVNFTVRKGLHLSVYGALALSAAGVSLGQGATTWKALAAGIVWGLPHAALDEFTQSTTTLRSSSLGDVGLDLVGMSIALAFLGRRLAATGKSSSPAQ